MISGSLVLTDTIGKSFDGVYGQSYKDADAVVSSKEATSNGRRAPRRRRSPPTCCAEVESLPGVARRAGLDRGRRRASSTPNGQGDRPRRRRRRRRRRPAADQQPQPAPARRAASWPRGDGADRDRQADRRGRSTSPSATRVGAFGDGPVQRVRGRRHRPLRHRRLARRRDDRRLRPADRAAAVRQAGQARRDPRSARSRASRRRARHGRSRRSCPRRRRCKTATAQAASDSKDDAEAALGFFKYVPARVRRRRAVRRRLGDREHALDHGRQRIRELATLRTLGASRRQVLRSVVLEAGRRSACSASVVGLFVGVALAKGLYVAARRDRRRAARTAARLRAPHGRRQPRRRHGDRAAREPAAGAARDAHPADRRRPRGSGAAAVAVRALRDVATPLVVIARASRLLALRRPRRRRRRRSRGCSRSGSARCCCSAASRWSRRG